MQTQLGPKAKKILVTGATGTVGSELVAALKKQGAQVRAGVRDDKARGKLDATGSEVVAVDYDRPATLRAALEGVDGVFMVTPVVPEAVVWAARLIDAATLAKVPHVVKLSGNIATLQPGITLAVWHRLVDRYLAASGLNHNFVSPTLFMQNFINYFPPNPEGALYLPHGTAKANYLDVRDVAEAAAVLLLNPRPNGARFELTGPENLTVAEIAKTLSAHSAKPVHYVAVSEAQATDAMQGLGMPPWAVKAFSELHALSRDGTYDVALSDDLQTLVGRPARTFSAFAAEVWRRRGATA